MTCVGPQRHKKYIYIYIYIYIFGNYFSLHFSLFSGNQEIKVAKKRFYHVTPDVFPYETSKDSLNRFSWKLILKIFNRNCLHTVMRRLTTEIRSEKCVVRRCRRCANVIECTYTNLDSTV